MGKQNYGEQNLTLKRNETKRYNSDSEKRKFNFVLLFFSFQFYYIFWFVNYVATLDFHSLSHVHVAHIITHCVCWHVHYKANEQNAYTTHKHTFLIHDWVLFSLFIMFLDAIRSHSQFACGRNWMNKKYVNEYCVSCCNRFYHAFGP